MTKRQIIRAMGAAGINGVVRGAGEAWEVELADVESMELFSAKVCPAGGFKTGYGSWMLRPNYKVSDLDFCNTASKCHY